MSNALKNGGGIVEAVVLDLGGVLVDHDDARAYKALGREFKVPAGQVRQLMLDDGLKARQDRGELSPQAFYRACCERFAVSPAPDRFWKAWSDIFSEKGEVVDLLFRLDGVVPLFLLSNTDPVHYAYLREQYPFMRVFNGEVLSYEVKACKPDPAIYRALVDLAGVPASHCLFFDDLQVNVDGAAAAGMNAHLFTGIGRMEEELSLHGLTGDGGD